MRQIPVQLLNALSVTATSANLREASERLGISQPGLTKQLQLLEATLPHPVFTRSGRRKILTPYGTELAAQLTSKFDGLGAAIEHLSTRFSQPELARVRITGRLSLLDRIVDRLRFPGELVFTDAASYETLRALSDRETEFGITYVGSDSPDLIAKRLYSEEFQIVIPKSLVKREPKNTRDAFEMAEALPQLAYRANDEITSQITEYFGLTTANLKRKRSIASFALLRSMAEQGQGWTLLPKHLSADARRAYSFPVPPKCHDEREFRLYYRPETVRAPWFSSLQKQIIHCYRA